MTQQKTHYRKAFKSPYLSSADIVGQETLTISHVNLEPDKTNKTKDSFNTAYFVEKEIRPGEKLKPMILNVGNSEVIKNMTNSKFLEDWKNIRVVVYVDQNVKFGRDIVEGLRVSPAPERQVITPDNKEMWGHAKKAYKRDGNFDKITAKADISEENKKLIIQECDNV